MPSQWKGWTAVTEYYSQCKVCDGVMDHEETWYRKPGASKLQSRPGAQSTARHRYPCPAPGELLQDAYVLQIWVSNIDSITFGKFVDQW